MSLFSKLSAAATARALAARGLAEERVEVPGGWSLRLWRRPAGRSAEAAPGAGETWLLLHGLGATASTWLPLLAGALDDVEVLAPELSELGGTRGPRPALGVRDGAAAAAAILEALPAGRRVTVAGVSLGGWIATRLALARPDLVERLVLVVPGGYREQDWERIERTVRFDSFRDSRAIWQALFHRPPWYLAAGRPFLYLAYRSEAVAAALAALTEDDAFDDTDLARLDRPVGLVWGEKDLLFRVADGRRMAAALPRARLYPIADAGHGVQWEKPKEFVSAIERFRADFPLPASDASIRIDIDRDGVPPSPGEPAQGEPRWPHPNSSSA